MPPESPPNRRPSLAFAVFLVFAMAYFQIRACTVKPPEPPPASAGSGAETPSDGSTASTAAPAPTQTQPAPTTPIETAFAATRDAKFDDQIVVDTDLYRARFTTLGGGLLQLDLKKYFRTASLARDPTRQQDPTAWLPLIVAPGPEMPI